MNFMSHKNSSQKKQEDKFDTTGTKTQPEHTGESDLKHQYVAYATFKNDDHTPVGDIRYGNEDGGDAGYDVGGDTSYDAGGMEDSTGYDNTQTDSGNTGGGLDDTGAAAYIGAEEGGDGANVGEDVSNDVDISNNIPQEDTYAAKQEKLNSFMQKRSSSHVPDTSHFQSEEYKNRYANVAHQSHYSGGQTTDQSTMNYQPTYALYPHKYHFNKDDDKNTNINDVIVHDDVPLQPPQPPPRPFAAASWNNQGSLSNENGSSSRDVSDQDYLLKYFPGAKETYIYDEASNIIGTTRDVNMINRKDIKKAVCAHAYFFRYGFVKNDAKSKQLAGKLYDIKPSLSFVSHLMKRSEKWLK